MIEENKSSMKNSVRRLIIAGIGVLIQIIWVVVLVMRLNQYSQIITLLTVAIELVLVLAVYSMDTNAAFKLPWIILITVAPIVGICVFFLFGRSGATKKVRARYRKIDQQLFAYLNQDEQIIEELSKKDERLANDFKYLWKCASSPVYKNTDVKYYGDKFGRGSFEILAPKTIEAKGSNNNSVAIKLMNGENSFVFTGDAEHESEAAMCNSGIDLSCDVLVPGHHGSATATSWDFLQKTVPEYAVISCGTNNKYGHPDKDTMDKLQSMDIQVYRTDKQGTIVVTSDGTNLNWSAEPCNDYTPGDDSDQGTQSTSEVQQEASQTATGEHVWVSATGNKYHKTNHCGNMNPNTAKEETREEAEAQGLEPCKKCY